MEILEKACAHTETPKNISYDFPVYEYVSPCQNIKGFGQLPENLTHYNKTDSQTTAVTTNLLMLTKSM
jgi:hypothetical protein